VIFLALTGAVLCLTDRHRAQAWMASLPALADLQPQLTHILFNVWYLCSSSFKQHKQGTFLAKVLRYKNLSCFDCVYLSSESRTALPLRHNCPSKRFPARVNHEKQIPSFATNGTTYHLRHPLSNLASCIQPSHPNNKTPPSSHHCWHHIIPCRAALRNVSV
jgi:hypothetical protein